MKFTINTTRLTAAVALANSVADTKNKTNPILGSVLLRIGANLTISATDLMVSVVETIAPDSADRDGGVLADAGSLVRVLKTLPGGSVTVERLDNFWIKVKSGKAEFKLTGMSDADFPAMADHRTGAQGGKPVDFVTVRGVDLLDLMARTEPFVSTDEGRVNLNGVLLESNGTSATMVSTDGHRLTKYTRPLDGLVLDKGIIIPLAGMREIKRVLDRNPGDVGLGIGKEHLFLIGDHVEMSVKLANVTFPPYNQVIPKGKMFDVGVDRAALASALRRCEVMVPDKTAAVQLRLSTGKLELVADNPDKGTSHQEVEVDYKGKDFAAGFNARYLLSALGVMDAERVVLRLNTELDPCLMSPVGDSESDLIAVVMPMRL